MRLARTGVADDYFPAFGDPSYDVLHYDLAVEYSVERNHLRGRAELRVRVAAETDRIVLDLHGLKVTRLQTRGTALRRFDHRQGRVTLRTERRLSPGQELTVLVRYAGTPTPIPDGEGEMGWEELTDGVLVAGQTNGAPSWFPCNDRPSSKASYRIEVTTASAYHVVANGALRGRRRGAGTTTWVYEQPEPMATYLATVQIGRYVARELPGAPVPMTAVLPAASSRELATGFGRQVEMMTAFIDRFGPYPFGSYGVVVTDDPLEIPLEAQGMAVFGSNFLTDDWECERLVAHELAHQWFGNSLTVSSWSDIWLHEGFACYAEWLWSEASGRATADQRAREHWDRLADQPQDLLLGDPGPELMFDDRVYKRGACLLHALRTTVGDGAFFALLRQWASRRAHGSVTTEGFAAVAAEVTGADLDGLLRSWLWQRELPSLPTAPA